MDPARTASLAAVRTESIRPASRALKLTLPSDLEIVMTRDFDAPRRLVFDAHVNPQHLVHWWIRDGYTLPVCEVDLRPGGNWRFVQRAPGGNEHEFRGVYQEIVAPERLDYTFEYEGMPGHLSLVTLTFDERHGVTTLTDRSLFETVEDRDGMLRSGMEAGAAEVLDRLDGLLRTLS